MGLGRIETGSPAVHSAAGVVHEERLCRESSAGVGWDTPPYETSRRSCLTLLRAGPKGATRGAIRRVVEPIPFQALPAETDVVEDFSQSQGDRLDLRGMVGHTSFPGSKLTFIGTAAFSGSAQTRSGAGSVRYSYRGDTTDTDTTNDTLYTDVTVDLDGNGKADFRVTLERAHYTLTDADLLLGYPTLWVAPPAVLAFGGEIEPAAVSHGTLSLRWPRPGASVVRGVTAVPGRSHRRGGVQRGGDRPVVGGADVHVARSTTGCCRVRAMRR